MKFLPSSQPLSTQGTATTTSNLLGESGANRSQHSKSMLVHKKVNSTPTFHSLHRIGTLVETHSLTDELSTFRSSRPLSSDVGILTTKTSRLALEHYMRHGNQQSMSHVSQRVKPLNTTSNSPPQPHNLNHTLLRHCILRIEATSKFQRQ